MKPIKLKEEEANNYVKRFLQQRIDCSEKIKIMVRLNQNYITSYELYEEVVHHGKPAQRLSRISYHEYIAILTAALKEKGYNVVTIRPIIREDIRYEIYFHIYERGTPRKRVRR